MTQKLPKILVGDIAKSEFDVANKLLKLTADKKVPPKQLRDIVTITSNYIAEDSDIILANASGGAITVTLPSLSEGLFINVKKIDSSGNAVTVVTPGDEKIDGAVSLSITTQYESYTLICDGTSWYII